MPGRPEVLTEELAKRIAKMIALFPDNKIPVTWENVIAHSKKRFKHGFNRQMLGQKMWDGRKLIAEAFKEAKSVQRRMRNDNAPKYKNSPRAILQERIAELEAVVLGLRDELETVRSQQFDALDAFFISSRDIRTSIETVFSKGHSSKMPDDELQARRNAAMEKTADVDVT